MLWVEKYRPTKVKDCILPLNLQKVLLNYIKKKDIPNLILYSSKPGSGKTTCVRALMDELNYEYMFVNASLERSIDLLRNKLAEFASGYSMTSKRRYIILDEADNFPINNFLALRGMIEEFSANCGWIFTCNNVNNIPDPIRSRLVNLDFNFKSEDYPQLYGRFMKRLRHILELEGIDANDALIAEVIKTYGPDFRRVINELQSGSMSGELSLDVLTKSADLDTLLNHIKDKSFKDVRQWVENYKDNDIGSLYYTLYNKLYDELTPQSIPDSILVLGDYQKFDCNVPSKPLNLMACLTHLMMECKFK